MEDMPRHRLIDQAGHDKVSREVEQAQMKMMKTKKPKDESDPFADRPRSYEEFAYWTLVLVTTGSEPPSPSDPNNPNNPNRRRKNPNNKKKKDNPNKKEGAPHPDEIE